MTTVNVRNRGLLEAIIVAVAALSVGGCSDDDNSGNNNNGDPCTHDCVAGARQCDGTRLEVCSPDGDACLRWMESEDCADSTALCVESGEDATCVDEHGCTDTCPASGDTRCDGSWVMTCGQSADGCLAWDNTEDCAASGAFCVLVTTDATCEAASTERVLFDATIDWQWPIPQDYGGYGFYWWHRNNEAQYTIANYGDMPTDDWVTPVDYEHGTVYLRFEVVSQPSSRPFRVQLGIWQDYGLQPHHRECIGPGNNVAGGAGTQFVDTVGSTFADWWNHPSAPGPCDFTRPEDFYRIGIVLWDQANSCIPMGHDWSSSGCPELQAEFFPMTARVTAVVVSAGETFSGWTAYP